MKSPSSSAVLAAAPPSAEGKRSSVNTELWQACAGPLVKLPAAGTHVIYFPQGHSEQVAASMKKEVDTQIPNYPNLSSKLLCLLHNIMLHADPETDEVYTQMTLQPVDSFDKEALLVSDLSLKVNKPQTEFFCKILTPSDTSTHGGFSVPRRAAEKIFPTLDFSMQPPAQELTARDLHNVVWTFRHVYRGQPKRHLLTTGWSHFVSGKKLLAGDSVLFSRDEKQNLFIGLRRANRQPMNSSLSMLSSNSMHIGVLAAAAHAAANNSPFTVFFNPRTSPSEFVIPLAKYYRAAYAQQMSLGMRFRMLFETEESGTRRFMGTISGISDLDPVRWKNSQWRNLQVGWDDTTGGERRSRVSSWEIEPVIAPFFIQPQFFGAKHPRQPGDDPSEFGNIFKRNMSWLGDGIYINEPHAFNGISLPPQVNMHQNPSLANLIQTNLMNLSPGFSLQSLPAAEIYHQKGFAAQQFTQQSNLQFNVPRQMQPAALAQEHDPLQTSPVSAHASVSGLQQQQHLLGISQTRPNLVNQMHVPVQIHSQVLESVPTGQTQIIPQTIMPLQNSQLQGSIDQRPYHSKQQPIFDESWRNSFAASQHLTQCNQISQGTSNQTQPEQQKIEQHQPLSLLSEQSTFQQPSHLNKIQDPQVNVSQSFCSSLVPSHGIMHSLQVTSTGSQSQIPAHESIRNGGENNCVVAKLLQQPSVGTGLTGSTPFIKSIANTVQTSVNMDPQRNNVVDLWARSSDMASNTRDLEIMTTNGNPTINIIPSIVQTAMHPNPQMNDVGDRLAQSSAIALNATGVATMTASGNSFIDFRQDSDIRSFVNVSKPQNQESFEQQSYDNVSRSHPGILGASSAASASFSQDETHLKQNDSASFNSQTILFRDRSQCNEVQAAEPDSRNIDSQLPTSVASESLLTRSMMGSVKDLPNNSSRGLITSYENYNDTQQELSSSMVIQSIGVPDMTFNSADSAMNERQISNQGGWGLPSQHNRIRTFTKVYKRGAVGRSVDVTRYSGYEELKQDLARRFGIEGQLEDRGRIGWKLVYVDHEGDVLLVGDDPWEEFIGCVRCIKILSPQEVQQMSLDGDCTTPSLLNQACSSSDGGNL